LILRYALKSVNFFSALCVFFLNFLLTRLLPPTNGPPPYRAPPPGFNPPELPLTPPRNVTRQLSRCDFLFRGPPKVPIGGLLSTFYMQSEISASALFFFPALPPPNLISHLFIVAAWVSDSSALFQRKYLGVFFSPLPHSLSPQQNSQFFPPLFFLFPRLPSFPLPTPTFLEKRRCLSLSGLSSNRLLGFRPVPEE